MPDLTITGPDESNIHGRLLEDVFVADETNIVSEYLTLDGDGATENQNVDGSSTAKTFKSSVVPEGKVFVCSRAMIYMEDSTAFTSIKFGGEPELTVGWQMAINGTVAFSAKNNKGLVIHMFDAHGSEIFGKLTQTMVGRFSFSKFTDGADGVTIRAGQTIDTIVNDNLTGLDYLHVMVQGVYKDA